MQDTYDRAWEGEEVSEDEWNGLCGGRENIEVMLCAMPQGRELAFFLRLAERIDEVGYLMLVDSNVTDHAVYEEAIWRAVTAGRTTWWIWPRALAHDVAARREGGA